jgi:hypothetical protein
MKSEHKGFVPPFLTPIEIFGTRRSSKVDLAEGIVCVECGCKNNRPAAGAALGPFSCGTLEKGRGALAFSGRLVMNSVSACEMRKPCVKCRISDAHILHTHRAPGFLFGARAATLVCVCSERAERVYRHKGPQVAGNTSLALERTHRTAPTFPFSHLITFVAFSGCARARATQSESWQRALRMNY